MSYESPTSADSEPDAAVEEFEETGFWNCQGCGMVHSHHPNLGEHNIMGEVETELDYEPRCPCGLHEAAKLHENGELEAEEWVYEALEAEKHKNYPIPRNAEIDIQTMIV